MPTQPTTLTEKETKKRITYNQASLTAQGHTDMHTRDKSAELMNKYWGCNTLSSRVQRHTVRLSQSVFDSSRVTSGTRFTLDTINTVYRELHVHDDINGDTVETYNAGFAWRCQDSQCSWGDDGNMQCKAVSCTLTFFLAARSMSASWQTMQLG